MTTPDAPNGPAPIAIRRLWPSDRAAVEAHFARLDPATRRNRFMGAIGDRAVAAYARRSLAAEGLMFGAHIAGEYVPGEYVAGDRRAGTLRAVAELRPAGRSARDGLRGGTEIGECAEAAFAVEAGYRRRGIGLALFQRLARAARNRGVRRLQVRCLAENAAMRGLAARLGADLAWVDGEAEGELRLSLPTPYSLWREGVEEGLDAWLAAAATLTPDRAIA